MEECEEVEKSITNQGVSTWKGLEDREGILVSHGRGVEGREESGFSGGDGAGESLSRTSKLGFLP